MEPAGLIRKWAKLSGFLQRITIILPPLSSSPIGGYKVQYEYANRLSRKHYEVTIVHTWNPFKAGRRVRDVANQVIVMCFRRDISINWFSMDPDVRVRLLPIRWAWLLPKADVTILTAWQTAARLGRSRRRTGTLVQIVYDYEYWRTASGPFRSKMVSAFRRKNVYRIATSGAVRTMMEEVGTSYGASLTCGIDAGILTIRIPPSDRDLVVGFPLRMESHKGAVDMFTAVDFNSIHDTESPCPLLWDGTRHETTHRY